MTETKLDLLQGTLDLLVLQTLALMGSLHGYGIARRIEQVSGNEILLNQGTIYASLVRLQQRGWISAEWGTSDNNRRAKYYALTKAGKKQLGLANIAREDTLMQQSKENKQRKEKLGLEKRMFNYQKMVDRESVNKSHILTLGSSLKHLAKSGMDMNGFMTSLYGATPQRMG